MLNSIAFIGNGVMAEAMIGGLLAKQLVTPDGIAASGPRDGRRVELANRYGIRSLADNREAARATDIVDRKSTRLNSSHMSESRMPSSA